MQNFLLGTAVTLIVLVGGFFAINSYIYQEKPADEDAVSYEQNELGKFNPERPYVAPEREIQVPPVSTVIGSDTASPAQPAQDAGMPSTPVSVQEQAALSFSELLALAGDEYASGDVPLGDNKYTLNAPKKGYIYYCTLPPKGGGAQGNPPWLGSTTWNFMNKVTVDGSKIWSNATFSNSISGVTRVITGNGLPVGDPTGNYPIASTDDAYQYDRNPNSISAQSYMRNYAASPVYSETPKCVSPGEVGMMLSGVPIYDGFDAEYRDAPAHEVQDSCNGHPHQGGVYHYHNLSPCVDDGVSTVIGYANDGFPITGPVVASGKYLTTADLDVCHGITSEVTDEKGKTYTTYHYVMTYDFPYSISCYRGTSVSKVSPSGGGQSQSGGGASQGGGSQMSGGQGGTPPQEAIVACSGKSNGVSCAFGPVQNGTCRTTPDGSFACVPQ